MASPFIMSQKKPKYPKTGVRSYRNDPGGKRKRWQWAVVIFVLILLFIFFTGNKSLLKLYSLHRQKNQLIKQKEELQQQSETLDTVIEKLKHDEQYLEKVAREKYNLKKEKEDVYIVEPK